MCWYQKGKTNLDFTEARNSEWQWHQLGHMQSAPRSRQLSVPAPHHFVQAGFPSCRPTNSIKALKDIYRVGQKTGLFFRVDNFAIVNRKKACDMSKVKNFV